MMNLRIRLLSIFTVCSLLTGCVFEGSKEEMGETFVRLKLDVEVSNLPSSPKTKGYQDPETDNEKMNTLRIIVVRESGIVEHNTYLNFTRPDLILKDMEYKVVGGEKKKIWLIANEGNSKMTYDFSGIRPGAEFPEKDVNEACISMTGNNDEITGWIPMTACHEVDMPLKDYDTELFIVRAATKFTYILTNNTSAPLHLSGLTISKGARKEYLFPRAKFGKWSYTDPVDGSIVTEDVEKQIISYEVPLVQNNEYYVFQKTLSVTADAGASVKIDPIFLLEGKYIDAASDGKNYSTSLTVNGIEYPSYLPELPQLPRNTHAVVYVRFSEMGISFTVEVMPYGEVILNPGFGQ
ncbi:MAG: hypothetical protein ACI3Y6_01105 [Candidatus Cryptobacteroides sp.]